MKNYRIEAAILAIGLALAGLFVYCGFKAFSQRDRVVSVRGLSEREVNADHVIWPITYKMTGNDLQSLYAQINQANVTITNFLTQNGIKKKTSAPLPRRLSTSKPTAMPIPDVSRSATT